MNRPTRTPVSAVIPTYQRASLLPRAIESALAQSYPPDEVIVVDDGSTDDTASVVQKYGELVRYARRANSGVSAARNHGAALARSAWLAFLDSDDIWRRDHLENLCRAIEASSGQADLYFDDSVVFSPTPTSFFKLYGFEPDSPFQLASGSVWAMRDVQPMRIQASIVRRSTYTQLSGMHEGLRCREDTHFFHILGLNSQFCAVPSIGVDVTSDADSDVRLATAHPSQSQMYRDASVELYSDVVRRSSKLSSRDRKVLRHRLSDAHVARAKVSWRKEPVRAALDICKSIVVAPRTLWPRSQRLLRRGLRGVSRRR